MALSFIGASSAAASSITVPGTYQAGDLLVIFAGRSTDVTGITAPAGWTVINGGGNNSTAHISGWKVAGSAAETSGTWTNATHLVCHVYRGQATNKVPIGAKAIGQATSATLSFTGGVSLILKTDLSSWVVGFAHHASATNVNVAPAGMTLQSGAGTTSAGGSDTNGIASSWATTTLGVNASGGWHTQTIEILAERDSAINNYQFIKVGDGMSVSEKIR